MYRKYRFEGDVHEKLDCVPLTVRRKLDLARMKISLAGWQSLTRAERLALCHLPVDTEEEVEVYREVLAAFAERAGAPLKELDAATGDRTRWLRDAPPEDVVQRARGFGALERVRDVWGRLDEESRYTLVKLSAPEKAPEKFRLALAELGLVEGDAMTSRG
jgi:hypothetical protein